MVEDEESVTGHGSKQRPRCQHEIRYDPVTGRSVIYAPMRQMRPREVESAPCIGVPLTFDKDCPFCPGNETWLMPLIDERPGGDAEWQTRVVLNRYPAVVSDIDAPARVNGIFSVLPARGRHEIIIESPKHDRDLAHAPQAEAEAVLQTCHARYRALADSGEFATILLFRNSGIRAGASLPHPHTQLVAMTQVTGELERRRAIAKSYFKRTGRCILCDIVSAERRDGRRLVFESKFFLGLLPIPSCDAWLPRRLQSCPSE
jgi:UDPglucose--hexose-1-phosphate uridylyltransferase